MISSYYIYHVNSLYQVTHIAIRSTTFTWQVTLTLSAVAPTGNFDNCQSTSNVDDYLEFLSTNLFPLSTAQQRYPECFL